MLFTSFSAIDGVHSYERITRRETTLGLGGSHYHVDECSLSCPVPLLFQCTFALFLQQSNFMFTYVTRAPVEVDLAHSQPNAVLNRAE
jgi:hypothetical protein